MEQDHIQVNKNYIRKNTQRQRNFGHRKILWEGIVREKYSKQSGI